MPLKSALLRDFGGCCFCDTIRACFLWLLEVTLWLTEIQVPVK